RGEAFFILAHREHAALGGADAALCALRAPRAVIAADADQADIEAAEIEGCAPAHLHFAIGPKIILLLDNAERRVDEALAYRLKVAGGEIDVGDERILGDGGRQRARNVAQAVVVREPIVVAAIVDEAAARG